VFYLTKDELVGDRDILWRTEVSDWGKYAGNCLSQVGERASDAGGGGGGLVFLPPLAFAGPIWYIVMMDRRGNYLV
jgi:hypothetical protein